MTTPWGVYGANYSGVTYKLGERYAPLYPDGTINTGALTTSTAAITTGGNGNINLSSSGTLTVSDVDDPATFVAQPTTAGA